jgi:hypothetical protein
MRWYCSDSPTEQAQQPFPLRFQFVLDPISYGRFGTSERSEAKQRNRLGNSMCDGPAGQGGPERVAELCRSGQLLSLCGQNRRVDDRNFESNRWQWKDGAWSH